MARFLADENFPGPVISRLRELGHDVSAVKDLMRGASDAAILMAARSQKRIVVTFDKDFGEMAFRFGLEAECGAVLFRLKGATPDVDSARALNALQSRSDWAGNFSTVTDTRTRMRSLPAPRNGEP
jgi:predicted nuclease of predicted toxin-antitoxin system